MAKTPKAANPAADDSVPEADAPDGINESQSISDVDDIDPESPDAAPATAPAAQNPEPVPLPARIRLRRPHGFVDEDGRRRHWQPGLVSDPEHVATLVSRGVPHEALEG